MSSDSTEIVTFFVISDSAGETATKLAKLLWLSILPLSSTYSAERS